MRDLVRYLGPGGVSLILGVILGSVLTIIGGILRDWQQARRDGRQAARKAIAGGERRISRMVSLAQYGAQVTMNRDEEYKLSHGCAAEVDELSGLLYGGPGKLPDETEKLLQSARDVTNRWQTIATRLSENNLTEAQKDEWYEEIRGLAPRISDIGGRLRPLLRDAWPQR